MNREYKLKPEEEEKIYHWLVHGGMDSAGAEGRADFEAWLQEKPARRHRARAVENIWNHPDFKQALTLVDSSRDTRPAPLWKSKSAASRPWYLAIAAGFLIAITTTLIPNMSTSSKAISHIYQTEPKQLSSNRLADGSTLDLSANTKVAVHYTERRRRIRLYNGEAQFTVAKDQQRPFIVESRQASVQALGTVFNVDQRLGVTELTVLEGKVSASPIRQPGTVVTVSAGETLRIAENATGAVRKFDLAGYKSWIDGYAQVQNLRLSELLGEFNRFSDIPLVAKGHDTANLRVSGSFDLKDIENNIRIVARLHNLHVESSDSSIVLEAPEAEAVERRNP